MFYELTNTILQHLLCFQNIQAPVCSTIEGNETSLKLAKSRNELLRKQRGEQVLQISLVKLRQLFTWLVILNLVMFF